eukprot:5539817-Pleurochrysis_carterae.AAC.3
MLRTGCNLRSLNCGSSGWSDINSPHCPASNIAFGDGYTSCDAACRFERPGKSEGRDVRKFGCYWLSFWDTPVAINIYSFCAALRRPARPYCPVPLFCQWTTLCSGDCEWVRMYHSLPCPLAAQSYVVSRERGASS